MCGCCSSLPSVSRNAVHPVSNEPPGVEKRGTPYGIQEGGASTGKPTVKMRTEVSNETKQHNKSTNRIDTVEEDEIDGVTDDRPETEDTPELEDTSAVEDTTVTEDLPVYEDTSVLNGATGSSDEDVYKMDHAQRGVFIIINNREFHSSTKMEERLGTDVDAAKIYQVFMELGFDVRMEHNKTKVEMLMILAKVAKEDHTNRDCFMCAILTHGDVDRVCGTDGAIPIDILVSPFKGQQCSTLRGKPKVFIVQACRGTKMDHGVEVADGTDEQNTENGRQQEIYYRIPQEADFLFSYSTAPGYVSWRHKKDGSCFIHALCRIFRNDSSRLEIMAMLTKVNRLVVSEFESNTNFKKTNRKKQMPSIVSMLTKQLYLPPK